MFLVVAIFCLQLGSKFVYRKRGGNMNTSHKPTMRILSILDFVSSESGGCKLSEISAELGIPMGTLSPIVHTLKDNKYLCYDERSQTYTIGIGLFEVGSRYMQCTNSFEDITSILQEIVQKCGETVHFGVLDGGNVLYLAKVDTLEPVRMYAAIGKRLPAYGTGIGKALLTDYTMEELHQIYPDGLKPLTVHTITTFDELHRQLQTIKETGFAYECEESNELIRCIARPIYKNQKIVAAISVSIPTFRYTKEKQDLIEQLLKEYSVYATQIVAFMNL